MNSRETKNRIAPIATRDVPMSPIPSEIFFDVTGSARRAVILNMTATASILMMGVKITRMISMIPKMPKIFLSTSYT